MKILYCVFIASEYGLDRFIAVCVKHTAILCAGDVFYCDSDFFRFSDYARNAVRRRAAGLCGSKFCGNETYRDLIGKADL